MVYFHRAAQLHWRRAVPSHISLQHAFYFMPYLQVTSSHTSQVTTDILCWTYFCSAVSIMLTTSFPLIFCFTPFSNWMIYPYLWASLPPDTARPSVTARRWFWGKGLQQFCPFPYVLYGNLHELHFFLELYVQTSRMCMMYGCRTVRAQHRSLVSRSPCCYSASTSTGRAHDLSWVGHGWDLPSLWQKKPVAVTFHCSLGQLIKGVAITESPDGWEHVLPRWPLAISTQVKRDYAETDGRGGGRKPEAEINEDVIPRFPKKS